MYQQANAPQSIGGVLNDALKLFSAAFGSIWALTLGFAVVFLLLYVGAIVLLVIFPPPALAEIMDVSTGSTGAAWGWNLLINFVIVIVQTFFVGALFSRILAVARGEFQDSLQALENSLYRLPAMLLFSIAALIAIIVVMASVLIPLFIGLLGPRYMQSDNLSLWAVIDIVTIVVPLVILFFAVKVQLFCVALFADNAGFLGALGSSWRLTRGRWWRTFTPPFVIALVMLFAMLILSFIIATLAFVLSAYLSFDFLGQTPIAQSFGRTGLTSLIVNAAAWLFISMVFIPFLVSTLIAVHRDCELRSKTTF